MSESKVIIKGITQDGLMGGTLKISANGSEVAELKKNTIIEIPITNDIVITAKCGFNKCKEPVFAKAGVVTEIEYIYDKNTGQIIPIVNGAFATKQEPVVVETPVQNIQPEEPAVQETQEQVIQEPVENKSRSTVAMAILSFVIATFLGVISAMIPKAGLFLMVLYGLIAAWATYMFLSEIIASKGVRVLIGIIVGIIFFFLVSLLLSMYTDPYSALNMWANSLDVNLFTAVIYVLPLTVLWFIPIFVVAKLL